MHTTSEILDVLKEENGNCSDYRLSKLLGITHQSVTGYRTRGRTMSDETAMKAAELLGWPHAYVVACVNAERHEGEESYPVWQAICDTLDPEKRAA